MPLKYTAHPCREHPTRMCPIQLENGCGKLCHRYGHTQPNSAKEQALWVEHWTILASPAEIDRSKLADRI